MTTRPTISALTHRVCSVEFMARSSGTCAPCMSASQPGAAALQPADDDRRVLDRGAQRAQRGGVVHRLGQRVVDGHRLVADGPGQQQDRHHQCHHDEHDDDADDPADPPAGGAVVAGRGRHVMGKYLCLGHVGPQIVSQKSRTGLRFAFTDGSATGTVDVRWATTWTPPLTAASVLRTWARWMMTRSRATAVNAMISPDTAMVIQAAAGMAGLPSSVGHSSVSPGAWPRSPHSAWPRPSLP